MWVYMLSVFRQVGSHDDTILAHIVSSVAPFLSISLEQEQWATIGEGVQTIRVPRVPLLWG